MQPRDLTAAQFAGYPPQARQIIVARLEVIRQLPISFVPSLLREAIDYDFKFPAERSSIDKELECLGRLTPAQSKEWFQPFADLSIPSNLERFDWVNQPAQFIEQQSAYLWSTHQVDGFRKAATEYGARLLAAAPPDPIPIRRLGIAVIGQGVATYDKPLFRNLRQHGTLFNRVKPDNGLALLLDAVGARAKVHPAPYGHWYVDGGAEASHSPLLTCISYQGLESVRAALLSFIQREIQHPGMGPEELRTRLALMAPSDLGMDSSGDQVLSRFQVKLLTEGSGTQIFSTTFAQWAAREVLRRAQALTLLVRFAPRQRQRPMNELFSNIHANPELDYLGSLVDADMGAYYQWINQQRLKGAEESAFLVWFEGHRRALVVAPTLPRGVESDSAMDLGQLANLAAT